MRVVVSSSNYILTGEGAILLDVVFTGPRQY
uniref:Uncharacterized protein n=1 Tax=Anguilla anguilla TaxID=7936 RepID=A0A0E9W7N5_ANGAN